MNDAEMSELQAWLGRCETRQDTIGVPPIAGLSATLDYVSSLAGPADELPPCWHWLYFNGTPANSELGPDGHPRLGGFLPPVPLTRRMWAGSRVKFLSPLRLGDVARRQSKIIDIRHRHGRTGVLIFVTLRHEIFVGDRLAVEEIQDLVYRDQCSTNPSSKASPSPHKAQWHRECIPDAVMLFRYSALTFNSHRIHFDRDYAIREEGYRSLVVQGPLTAILLLDLLRRQQPLLELAYFEFQAVAPLLEGSVLTLQGRRDGDLITLWALDSCGGLAMRAQAGVVNDQ